MLLGLTVMSHVVVGLFAAVGALVIVAVALTNRYRSARWTLGIAAAIGAVAMLLTAFWSVPLVATFGYTANMRYTKITEYADYLLVDEFLWVYLLALVGLALGIAFRDRATLIVAAIAVIFALVFRFWPELHAWNLRFLPFWYLGCFFLAAIGAAEIVRRLSDQLGRLWVGPPATAAEAVGDEDARESRLYRVVTSSTVIVAVAALTIGMLVFNQLHAGFLGYWATWNETGYENAARAEDPNAKAESRKQYREYRALTDRMAKLPPGRALWEGGGSIDAYGTPLALMLLPYWTHGRIKSFEGLYYESAASTPYVFMAVAPLSAAGNASNPVRGLDYLTIANFGDGVRYLRALGGRYYVAHSPEAKAAADRDPGLRRVAQTPDIDKQAPEGWSIYEVRGHALVAPLRYEPVVTGAKAGTQSDCFDHAEPTNGVLEDPGPELGAWECIAAGWWSRPERLDRPLAEDGPPGWKRAKPGAVVRVAPRPLPDVAVTDVHQTDDAIRFHVSRTGVPVVVRTSYYPNWEASGATGPWRLSPNLMVVVPTSEDVSLHFARSSTEWLGAGASALGVAGLAGLVWWDLRRRRAVRATRMNRTNAAS